MPFMLSIQPVIDAQTSALNTTINTARDAVNTNTNTKTGEVTTAVNAARDNVKADNVTQIGTQTTSITNAVTAARDNVNANTNAKSVIKSIQRGSGNGATGAAVTSVVIASVNPAKCVVHTSERGGNTFGGGGQNYQEVGASAKLVNATTLELDGSSGFTIEWTVVEYF